MGAQPASGPPHAPASDAPASAFLAGKVPEAAAQAGQDSVSWSVIFAGATAASALSLVLHLLGSGLGLAALPPWAGHGGAVGVSTIAWLLSAQLAAAALGGFLAGRLCMKWPGLQDKEVRFRDSAHGLLSWAVSILVTVAFLFGGIGKLAGGAAAVAATPAGDAAHAPDYLVDVMLRSERAGTADAGLHQQALRILASGVANGRLAVADRDWLTRRIADRTGLDSEDAGKRVDDAFAGSAAAAAKARAGARDAREHAREAAAAAALWLTVALLPGAFVASRCARIGGAMRDRLPAPMLS